MENWKEYSAEREIKETKLLEVQSKGSSLLREQVTEDDIAEIVAKWTGNSDK